MTKIAVKTSLNPAAEALTEGWHQLQATASHAVVRFNDGLQEGSVNWSYLPVDLYELDALLVLHMEIPGMVVSDFEITIFGNNLVISGSKKAVIGEEVGACMFSERAYGEFERSIPLIKPVDEAQATANYLQGVLTITLPVLRDGFCRRIEVQGE